MHRHYRKTFLGLGALVLAGAFTAPPVPAFASSFPVTDARIVAHFDFTAGQQPENIVLEPNGDADVTFAFAHQVARVTPRGKITILATLPAATSGTTAVSGVVRTSDGTLYVNYIDIGGSDGDLSELEILGMSEEVAERLVVPVIRQIDPLAINPRLGFRVLESDAAAAHLEEVAGPAVQTGKLGTDGGHFAYFDTRATMGVFTELIFMDPLAEIVAAHLRAGDVEAFRGEP
jgi:hypothetical protein